MTSERTLAEAMAVEVLRGDMVAAYALADRLLEQRDGGIDAQARAARELREHPTAADGYGVYRWPEFIAFCKRAGILWDLRTVSMEFTIGEGQPLTVRQVYIGTDTDATYDPRLGATPEHGHAEGGSR